MKGIKSLSIVLAISAIAAGLAAPTASATQYHIFTSPSAVLTGEQTQQLNSTLTASGASTKCSQALFEGTLQGGQSQITAEEWTLTPILSNCQIAGLATQLLFNGCKFTVTNKSSEGITLKNTAFVDLVGCTAGKQVENKVTGCTITIPEQFHISHAVGSTIPASPSHVEVELTLQGIKYEFHGIACPKPTPKPTELAQDGDLTGKITLKAYADNGTEQVTLNGHQYSKGICGIQVSLTGT